MTARIAASSRSISPRSGSAFASGTGQGIFQESLGAQSPAREAVPLRDDACVRLASAVLELFKHLSAGLVPGEEAVKVLRVADDGAQFVRDDLEGEEFRCDPGRDEGDAFQMRGELGWRIMHERARGKGPGVGDPLRSSPGYQYDGRSVVREVKADGTIAIDGGRGIYTGHWWVDDDLLHASVNGEVELHMLRDKRTLIFLDRAYKNATRKTRSR